MLPADAAKKLLVDFIPVNRPVNGLPDPRIQVGFPFPIEAVLKPFLFAGPGFLRVVHPADDKRHLNGRQLALQHLQISAFRIQMQLPADFPDLHLPGGQLRQPGGFLRDQHILHLRPEGRTPVVVGVAGVQQVDINRAPLKLPGPHADRILVGRNPRIVGVPTSGIVLRFGVHKHIALLGAGEKVHQRIGRLQIELDGGVIQRHNVGQQLRLVLPKQPAKQPGVRSNRILPHNQRGAVRHILRGKGRAIVESNIIPQVKSPLRAVLVGLPPGRNARNQRAVKAVGMHQRVGKGPHLRVCRSGRPQPAAHQLLHRRNGGNAEPPANRLGFLRRRGRVRRAGRRRSDDHRRNGGCGSRRPGIRSRRLLRRSRLPGPGPRRRRGGVLGSPAAGYADGQQQRGRQGRYRCRLNQFQHPPYNGRAKPEIIARPI